MTHGYTVSYNSSSHWNVITQMWGSVWPRVLPYCIFNTCIAAFIEFLDAQEDIDLAISDKGHSFMNLMVAFLVVSRVNISIGRYNEARSYLAGMYQHSRELIQNMVVLTGSDTSQKAKQWRNQVAYRMTLLLRISMGAIGYSDGDYVSVWDLPELEDEERAEMKKHVYYHFDSGSTQPALQWAHAERTEYEENLRVPIRLAHLLRLAIRSQRSELKEGTMSAVQENKLMSSVDAFMGGYYGIRKFLTTPFPFPLVQMARTFLFFYVYTVPFALLSDTSSPITHCIVIFILTAGFMGLEYISIELDNPFGKDANDFDNLGMAFTAFEDTYLTILTTDGPEWTAILRNRMQVQRSGGRGEGETSPLVV